MGRGDSIDQRVFFFFLYVCGWEEFGTGLLI